MHSSPARNTVALAFAVAALALAGVVSAAYPSKPIRIIVPYTPGGPTDLLARSIGAGFTEAWGQSALIENRAGASGNVGTAYAAKQPPDGHTLAMVGISFSVASLLSGNTGFDPVRDFAPITLAATVNNVLSVHPSLPARSVKELIALARARPGELAYASGGAGGAQHLAGELFNSLTRVKMVHVPYRGSAPGLTALISGEVVIGFGDMLITRPHIESGKLRGLAVTGPTRSALLPALPTVAESGLPGYAVTAWFALVAPAGTPADIISRLSSEATRTMRSTTMSERLSGMGADPVGSTPEQLATFLRAEIAKWAAVVKSAGIKAGD
jgi:tripartite-type tricarboxylate transporter receptor subunit TctC